MNAIPGLTRRRRFLVALGLASLAVAALAGCGATAASTPAAAGKPVESTRPTPGTSRTVIAALAPVVYDAPGHYRVGQRWFSFSEPSRAGTGGNEPRRLLTQVLWPLTPGTGSPAGPRPLLVFAPGFMQCGHPYYQLLAAWASAGYVVAVVDFPHSDCLVGPAATETDMVNQPADVSYVITSLLGLSASHTGPLAGLIGPGEIGITGQSDGGDTVAAIAANSCCSDPRVRAVAVLSGAEWPPMPGRYFQTAPVPMLFTQGSADTINPAILSVTMYQQDPSPQRFYLDLLGADHTTPYWGINPDEEVVARVTLDFFNRYLLGRNSAAQLMVRDGTVAGVASLSAGSQPAP